MDIQIAIHSSPRFSTWLWIPDWRTLFDAGDGASQQLGYKIRKIDTVACTHAHRDHQGGLLQVINQRGEAGSFAVAYPCGGHSFRQLEEFSNRFNPASSRNAVWHALEEGDELPTGMEGKYLKAFRTQHYAGEDTYAQPRSLGYHLMWRKLKVRPELRALPQSELDALRLKVGREGITSAVDEKWVTVSGDSSLLSPGEIEGTRLLIHEATFLREDDYDEEDAGDGIGHVHSTVEGVLQLAKECGIGHLVLYHISTRYTDAEIRAAIYDTAKSLELETQIWAVLPRRVYWNLLKEKPVWRGKNSSASS